MMRQEREVSWLGTAKPGGYQVRELQSRAARGERYSTYLGRSRKDESPREVSRGHSSDETG